MPMDTSYADAVVALEEAVDQAANEALTVMNHREVANELRKIAQGWEDAA